MEITLTKGNFEDEVLKSEIPVLVDFWASWCGPCKMLAPTVAQIAEEYSGKIKVGKVNVDEEESLSREYGIVSIPTVILFKNGKSQTVPDGNLGNLRGNRLSQGTTEAILYSSILSYLKHAKCSTIYVDECLSHMHSELEKYLIWLSILLKEKDSQLFFTTHNVEICDLQLPTNAFLFLKRNKEGLNEAFWANTKLIKNDRSFRNYYENDYFGVLPDYSSLIALLHKEGE